MFSPPMLNTILLLPYETKHGDVGEVIFIGMAHDKWDGLPLAIARLYDGKQTKLTLLPYETVK